MWQTLTACEEKSSANLAVTCHETRDGQLAEVSKLLPFSLIFKVQPRTVSVPRLYTAPFQEVAFAVAFHFNADTAQCR